MGYSQNIGPFGYRLHYGTSYLGVSKWDPILGTAHIEVGAENFTGIAGSDHRPQTRP